MKYRIGIDIGGTFTDFFLQAEDGRTGTWKQLSTPKDPSAGLIAGLERIAESEGLPFETFVGDIETIVHGTTVTTNATLTRGGVKTGLLTTRGMRDALEMRRGIRERQYDNRYTNVEPLVPRELRLPVGGRIDRDGREIEALDEASLEAAVATLASEGVEAAAICFMNSFANPVHEREAARYVAERFPGMHLSVSSELLPVIRFYDRVSTTVLNAYVGPILSVYLDRLGEKLAEAGFRGVLLVMQSNGGVALPEIVRSRAASTLLSGPAGGPRAAAAYVGGDGDCIVVDMGGTSFDASLVRGGEAEMNMTGEIDRLRIALPMLAITTIGAGGGSIGWTDEGGLLRMGPRSAGADPGPACYGRGGGEPTCTDANVVLGFLDPSFFAGGRIPLDIEAARTAIGRRIAAPLDMTVEEAAAGMFRVINTNMAHGVREITVKRGLDPRVFPMVVAGGAGGLHACMIALELDLPRVLFPRTASVLCAAGMLRSDLKHDEVRSFVTRFADLDVPALNALVEEMTGEGMARLEVEGVPEERRERRILLDLRYLKQYHEVQVEVPEEAVRDGDLETIASLFHREHDRLFGYELSEEGTGIELINVRVRVIGRVLKPELPLYPEAPEESPPVKGERRAFSPEEDAFTTMPVYDFADLLPGSRVEGPALCEREDTTLFVSRSFTCKVDRHGTCVLERKETEA